MKQRMKWTGSDEEAEKAVRSKLLLRLARLEPRRNAERERVARSPRGLRSEWPERIAFLQSTNADEYYAVDLFRLSDIMAGRSQSPGAESVSKAEEAGKEDELAADYVDEDGLKKAEEGWTDEEKEEHHQAALRLKEEGNATFKELKYEEARLFYTEALKKCPTCCPKDRAVLYHNRAVMKTYLKFPDAAIDDLSQALKYDPTYTKALLRRAAIFEESDRLDEALKDYQQLCELDPSNRTGREALIRLPPLVQEKNEKLKAEMLDKLKDLGNMVLKPFGLSTENFNVAKDPQTGNYSINFQNSSS
ncbi:unnamed protein product [Darwinula stevensoni]|uniref:Tetratricopeptide repeat protein 1 n=1 Tax=Darwinula stevensoni TaxID=69355 RepID=A0A7R9A5H3_9CRUS|nr:unnamed protein product [Darwinula stevensoni]CAG0895606.1 unnamed protein product [Darwinula stevensoni]